jgi:pre-mRNA-splicing factor ISY1
LLNCYLPTKGGRTQIYDIDGKELPGQPGYKYFGAAKGLPGVRELFAEERLEIETRRKRK